MARYLIGIDLGTTNSALAYIDLKAAKKGSLTTSGVQAFAVPQLVNIGETAPRELLPSFLYLPGPHDLPAGATALPWDRDRSYAVGEFARNHGSRIPGRLVSSAKSWLCHAGVDRSAPLLPWSAPPDVPRISPVEASARYLRHMVDAWNHAMAKDKPDHRLEKQAVVLTVPASFDDMARTLTVEAAKQAGLENITLLEEPQAAFYCWLATHSANEASQIKPGWNCLVIDVGGGTSDFSLIQAVEQEGELGFIRQAVGDHLLLGGDNMDLALAKFVETRLPAGGKLDAAQYGLLTQACRQAKETLLRPDAPGKYTVTVMGRGRQVVGGAVHTDLTSQDVRKVILDGFLPLSSFDADPTRGGRTGLHEMGLPYVSDPAITKHLAGFLRGHLKREGEAPAEPQTARASGSAGASPSQAQPQAILFNGGVFQPSILRERVVEAMTDWFGKSWKPLVLTNPSLDLAVAWGAAHFAWLKHTGGRRIGGGIARSYYLGVAAGQDDAKLTLLCVVPQHLEEGKEIELDKPELELALGQPVMFPLYTSTVRGEDRAGQIIEVTPKQLLQLPPLHTILRGGKRSGTKTVPVRLAARSTEIGTLELFCVAKEGSNRWRLEFNVRDIVKGPEDDEEATETRETLTDVWPEAQVQEAGRLIRLTMLDKATEPIRQLTKSLETALDTPRDKWPTGLCRRLWDFLSEVAEERRNSPAHHARWFNLVGFCLRPGFGDPLDKFRVEQLWKLLQTPSRSAGTSKTAARVLEGGADYWIMWRRVAGGLNTQLQSTLYNRLRAVLLPGKGKPVAKPHANELAEMWRAVASLERIDGKQKESLGESLLKQVRRSPAPTYGFFGLTRLGARVLLYGPLNAVIHHEVAQRWLEAVLTFSPGNQSERLAWAFCLSQLARRTGQRALDVDDVHRERVIDVLKEQSIPGHWLKMVEEVSELESDEQSQMFGESLPIGLRLIRDSE